MHQHPEFLMWRFGMIVCENKVFLVPSLAIWISSYTYIYLPGKECSPERSQKDYFLIPTSFQGSRSVLFGGKVYFRATPHPGCQSPPRLWTIFRLGNLKAKLHWWLLLGGGGRPIRYTANCSPTFGAKHKTCHSFRFRFICGDKRQVLDSAVAEIHQDQKFFAGLVVENKVLGFQMLCCGCWGEMPFYGVLGCFCWTCFFSYIRNTSKSLSEALSFFLCCFGTKLLEMPMGPRTHGKDKSKQEYQCFQMYDEHLLGLHKILWVSCFQYLSYAIYIA